MKLGWERAQRCLIALAVLTGHSVWVGSSAGSKPLVTAFEGLMATGWAAAGESRAFHAGNLWEYIDGDAERYVDAGVREVQTMECRFHDRLEAVVDIYRMRDPQGARTIFASESDLGTEAVEIGEEARLHDTGLTFRLGPHFVRISAFEPTPETREALLGLGRALARRLAQP